MRLKGHLKPLVLELLKEKDKTGSEIAEEIEKTIDKRPSCGSIYPLLKEMEKSGLVKSSKEGRKKYYSLTNEGIKAEKKVKDEREEIINKILEGLKAFNKIFSEEDTGIFIQNLERIKETKEVKFPEIFRVIDTLLSKNLDEKESEKVRKILNNTAKEIEKI